jgi:hypothetical protein
MVVWGGYDGTSDVNSGGRYDPGTDIWTAVNTTNAPSARDYHTAVWTSSEMIVWGGCANCSYSIAGTHSAEFFPPSPTPTLPTSPTLIATMPGVTPTPSDFGGTPTSTPIPSATASPSPGTGGRYDPSTDSWIAISTTNAPSPRDGHTAVWSGSEMIVWGGNGDGGSLNTGGRYCAQLAPPTPTPLPPSPTPTPTLRSSPIPRPRPTPAPRP